MKILTWKELEAQCNFDKAHVKVHDKHLTIEEARKRFDVSAIVSRFGTWAVTTYGVECLARYYPIPKDRLWEDRGGSWEEHMGQKVWCKFFDFWRAITFAREHYHAARKETRVTRPRRKPKGGSYHSKTVNRKTRFDVLRRDNYRCQICGRCAKDGATLEVDHKVPRSKGGSNDPLNLWALCLECNRGKGDGEL